jgi:integrase
MDLTMDQFSDLHGQVKNANLVKTKKFIRASFKHITDLIDDILIKEPFSHERLAKRLSRGTKDSVFTYFDNRIADLNNQGKVGSVVWLTSAKNSFWKFANQKDLKFSQLTPDFLRKYQRHLIDDGCEFTTVAINARALRSICNIAKSDGIINEAQYPFEVKKNGKFKIPEGVGTKRALTEAQLYKVFEYELMPTDEIYRDLWVFSFYAAGMNIGDMLRLKWKQIIDNGIEFYRQKTRDSDNKKIKIRVIITPEMQKIMDDWGNIDQRPESYIFPYLKPNLTAMQERMIIQNKIHCINKRMKRIGRALGYGDVTTYWSRHSWASISRRKGVPTFAISKGLGHKNLATTMVYLDSLPDDELQANAELMPRRQI